MSQYNQVAADPLPVLPLVFDEFGLVAGNKQIVFYTRKLSAGGRKVGVFCIFAAQTWNASEISTAIRSNLATSIQHYARDKSQSRVLLGDGVAAQITRPGEAYASLPGVAGLVKMQTPLLTEKSPPTRREPAPLDLPDPAPDDALSPEDVLSPEDEIFLNLVKTGSYPSDACFKAYGKQYAGALFYHCKQLLEGLSSTSTG